MPAPVRIVCLQPSATAILAKLGELDRIVGCTRYCIDVCPKIAGREVVQDSWTAQAEQIARLRPDLVIAAVPYQEKAIAEILKAGTRVLLLAPRTLADIFGDISTIAGAIGAGERAQDVISEMQRAIRDVTRRTASASAPRVYCEEWGKPLIASQPWVAELARAAGGEFVLEPARPTTAELVREAAPDVIVIAWCGAGDRVPLEKIVAERQWENVPAVRSGRVYCVRDELLNTPAPTLLGGLRALAHAIHPEVFPASPGIRRIAGAVL